MNYTIKIDNMKYAVADGRQALYEYLEQIECEMGDKLTITIDISKKKEENGKVENNR
jgi:hypothetical protein